MNFGVSIDYARALATGAWAEPANRLPLVLLTAAVFLFLVWRPSKHAQQTSRRREEPEERDSRRPTNTALLRRFWWKLRPPHDVMSVDGLVLERTGSKSHALWLGPTGGGKSASVATVRVNGQRPTLIVTPDLSDPMIASTYTLNGFRWTAGGSVAVDFLIGTPGDVAERLTEVFRSGGVGAWKMTARRVTTEVIEDMDYSNERRALKRIGELLRTKVSSDRELKTVCGGWVERFLSTALIFGDSIAAGGVDIAELLLDGQTVLLDNDAFAHPSLVGDVVAFGLAEAKRCATLCPDGFRLIFEEAGQLGDRIDLADPFFRAGRRRKIAVDALTQAESDLDDAITQNAGTRVYFSQELKSLQKIAADRLGLDYRELATGVMKDYTAWIASRGIRRLVKFPKPLSVPLSRSDTFSPQIEDTDSGHRRRVVVAEVAAGQRAGVLALPPPRGINAILAAGLYREGDCERWSGDHNDKGYGRVRLPDGRREYVHRLRWELAYGPIPLAENGMRMTIDHRRTCFKDCSRLEHLEMVSRGENSKRRWRVRGS